MTNIYADHHYRESLQNREKATQSVEIERT